MADRRQVMNFRIRAQQLDRARGTLDDTAVLDIGVQASGPDGANWALAVRGVDVAALSGKDLVLLWTVRGAPHLYRRADVGKVAAAVRAGLELQPDTSPPVLRRITGFRKAAGPGERFDVVRAYLRLLGPATPKHVAGYLDAPVKDVQARWPGDAVEVTVDGEVRWLLAADEKALGSAGTRVTRLLGPFDLLLQARDRATL